MLFSFLFQMSHFDKSKRYSAEQAAALLQKSFSGSESEKFGSGNIILGCPKIICRYTDIRNW